MFASVFKEISISTSSPSHLHDSSMEVLLVCVSGFGAQLRFSVLGSLGIR